MKKRIFSVSTLAIGIGSLVLSGVGPALASNHAGANPAGAIQPQAGGDGTSMPGRLVEVYAKPYDETARVTPPAPRTGGLGAKAAEFEVTYNGFTPEAKVAFQYAVDIWASQLSSPVPIRVNANWTALDPGVLGSAGPGTFSRDFSGAPQSGTWYPIAAANRLAGRDLTVTAINPQGTTHVNANFSSAFTNWYFGTDGNPPPGKYDFVSVVLHELGHGLGFLGSMQVVGGLGTYGLNTGFPMVYDHYTLNGSGLRLLALTNPSADLGLQLLGQNLYFDGPNAVAGSGGSNPRLYAPTAWQQGSSYSHLDENTYTKGNPNSLMTPQIGTAEAIHNPGPITLGIFQDTGWAIENPSATATATATATTAPATATATTAPATATSTVAVPTPTYSPTPEGTPASFAFLPMTIRTNTATGW